ncbi:MAG: hypothetical protein EXS39_02170 [Opitutaceae bacterium]|nr:hypothetical protein [Opitutaceae bacterium]
MKLAVEMQMAQRFIDSMTKALAAFGEEFMMRSPETNVESGLDLTVMTPRGLADLELMEVAVLIGPYKTAPSSYELCRLCDLL